MGERVREREVCTALFFKLFRPINIAAAASVISVLLLGLSFRLSFPEMQIPRNGNEHIPGQSCDSITLESPVGDDFGHCPNLVVLQFAKSYNHSVVNGNHFDATPNDFVTSEPLLGHSGISPSDSLIIYNHK